MAFNSNSTYLGEVVNVDDPDKEGRCKIRVFNLFDNLSDEDLPWASPGNGKTFAGGANKGFGDLSVPKVGTVVKVYFESDDPYTPFYNLIQIFSDEAKAEIDGSYLGSTILMYDVDEQVKVFYTPGKGLNFFHKDSAIIINPDSSVTIQHKDSESIIELIGGKINIVSTSDVNVTSPKCVVDSGTIQLGENAVQSLIKGEAFKVFFDTHTHAGAGSPPLVPMPPSLLSNVSKTI
jgi:hypothetical protein